MNKKKLFDAKTIINIEGDSKLCKFIPKLQISSISNKIKIKIKIQLLL